MSRHVWTPIPVADLRPGDRVWPGRNCRVRIVNKLDRWKRWDGERMVTVIDHHGCALAARPEGWRLLVQRWDDGLRVIDGGGLEPLLRREGML